MTRNQQLLNTQKIRQSRRGAAMVEAAVIFPVLVLFLGYMTFFHNIHKIEFKVMAEARKQAWKTASHGCDGSSESTQSANNPTNASSPGGAKVMSGFLGGAQGSSTGTADSSPFTSTLTSRTITHTVYVTCNENVDAEANVLSQLVSFAGQMLTGIL